jgi:multisubunit Na+/H+ antiporter MnhG subunit
MGIDIRFPIGLMFGVVGILLTAFGIFGDKAIYQRSLGINVNLQWGVAMIMFGVIMLVLAIRAHGKPQVTANDPEEGNRLRH